MRAMELPREPRVRGGILYDAHGNKMPIRCRSCGRAMIMVEGKCNVCGERVIPLPQPNGGVEHPVRLLLGVIAFALTFAFVGSFLLKLLLTR